MEFVKDIPVIIAEVVEECVKRGVNPEVIGENIEEFVSLYENTIPEELGLSMEILGRGLTRNEVITILTQKIIELSKQKKSMN